MSKKIKLCNGFSLMVREKLQGFVANSRLVLPDTKWTSSKVGVCLVTSSKKLKGGALISHIKVGDRVLAKQYDYGFPITMWETTQFLMPKKHYITQERLPDGCELVTVGCREYIEVKKGTPLQTWIGPGDDMEAIIDFDGTVDD